MRTRSDAFEPESNVEVAASVDRDLCPGRGARAVLAMVISITAILLSACANKAPAQPAVPEVEIAPVVSHEDHTCFRDEPYAGKPVVVLGTRLLRKVPEGDRGRASELVGDRVGREGSDVEPGQQRSICLL